MNAECYELEVHRNQNQGTGSLGAYQGAKLRLLIADPIKGMHLREAIAQLKTALKEAYGKT